MIHIESPELVRSWRERNAASPPIYADSALYVMRACRGSVGEPGTMARFATLSFALGRREDVSVVVRPDGDAAPETWLALASALRPPSGGPVVFKYVAAGQFESLAAHPAVCVSREARDEALLHFEDERFPPMELVLSDVLADDGRVVAGRRDLARKIRRFAGSGIDLRAVDVSAELVCDTRLFGATKRAAYAAMLHAVSGAAGDTTEALAYVDAACVVHGVYVAEALSADVWGLYCAVSSRAQPGITEAMDVDFCRRLARRGARRVLLGGAETAGVARYLEKLAARPAQPATVAFAVWPSAGHSAAARMVVPPGYLSPVLPRSSSVTPEANAGR